jgi:hypothetical protein
LGANAAFFFGQETWKRINGLLFVTLLNNTTLGARRVVPGIGTASRGALLKERGARTETALRNDQQSLMGPAIMLGDLQ